MYILYLYMVFKNTDPMPGMYIQVVKGIFAMFHQNFLLGRQLDENRQSDGKECEEHNFLWPFGIAELVNITSTIRVIAGNYNYI